MQKKKRRDFKIFHLLHPPEHYSHEPNNTYLPFPSIKTNSNSNVFPWNVWFYFILQCKNGIESEKEMGNSNRNEWGIFGVFAYIVQKKRAKKEKGKGSTTLFAKQNVLQF